jgi:hypothetical protein
MLLDVPGGANRETLHDPVSGRAYGYRILDSLTYELCAEFQTTSDPGGGAYFWRHGPGRKCFRVEAATR